MLAMIGSPEALVALAGVSLRTMSGPEPDQSTQIARPRSCAVFLSATLGLMTGFGQDAIAPLACVCGSYDPTVSVVAPPKPSPSPPKPRPAPGRPRPPR